MMKFALSNQRMKEKNHNRRYVSKFEKLNELAQKAGYKNLERKYATWQGCYQWFAEINGELEIIAVEHWG